MADEVAYYQQLFLYCHSITEGHWISQARFALCEAMFGVHLGQHVGCL